MRGTPPAPSASPAHRRPPLPRRAQTLYGSGRFNDDDEEDYTVAAPDPEDGSSDEEADAPPAPAAAAAAAPAAPADGTEVRLPPARNVRVKTAEFIKSSPDVASCPPAVYPEFAVIGRSNVGKSSLINLLTGRNALAMVSKTPGKTKLINHFLINGAWYLVDLPGYGYARASKDKVLTWNRFTREYFLQRPTLASVLLLIDASIPPMELDISCANWLGEAGVAYTLVYTKMDKRKKGEQKAADNIAAFEAALAGSCDALPPAVATSARSGAGKAELLAHIARLRGLYNAQRA